MDIDEVIARTPSDDEVEVIVARVMERYEYTDTEELGALLDDEFRKEGYTLRFARLWNLAVKSLNDW